MLKSLKEEVCRANLDLVKHNLVLLTWGNVSGIDRKAGLMVIKPSGVPYEGLTPAHMAVVDMDGKQAEGKCNPSSDTPTHLELYKAWPEIGGIAHTHSPYATAFAQALCPIPCLGTTHADQFYGEVPVTRTLTKKEVDDAYEKATGEIIIHCFEKLDPMQMQAVLAANHGPFTWGKNAAAAALNSFVLEEVAEMALATLQINKNTRPLPQYILQKHYLRKHGPDASYGQKKPERSR